jgi:hypothetical protein
MLSVLAAALLLAAPGWSCKQDPGEPPARQAPAVKAAPAAPSAPAAPASGSVWEDHCSPCHDRSDHEGLGAQDIRDALQEVPAMAKVKKQISVAEIEKLAGELVAD